MAQITQNDITFNSYVDRGGQTITYTPLRQAGGKEGPDNRGGIVNAVDIDWNDANLALAVDNNGPINVEEGLNVDQIKTTGDLLSVIANQQSQINTLQTMIKALYLALKEN